MHEQALATDLVRKAVEVARREGAGRVTAIQVRIGALSHVTPAALEQSFRIAAGGSLAEGAEVKVVVGDDVEDALALDIVLDHVVVESD